MSFPIQDDFGSSDGIAPIPQWYRASSTINDAVSTVLDTPLLDPEIADVLCRLHNLFDSSQYNLTSTDLHDLTCYAVHKLLLWEPWLQVDGVVCDLAASSIVRHATVLYLLIIHGPTYFSHTRLQYATALKLQAQMEYIWFNMLLNHGALTLWLLSVGMVASDGTPECQWFMSQARKAAEALDLRTWDNIVIRLRDIVWLDSAASDPFFQQKWQEAWSVTPT
ncbi:hypothetical protein N0V86_006266 [Didymella sp. IMI 355093]|nr:hypothetical protein N0V86_006266 [Didymella sp. IMI 355093]